MGIDIIFLLGYAFMLKSYTLIPGILLCAVGCITTQSPETLSGGASVPTAQIQKAEKSTNEVSAREKPANASQAAVKPANASQAAVKPANASQAAVKPATTVRKRRPRKRPQVKFAPTYVSTPLNAFQEAHEIYQSSVKATTGVYKQSGLVFVIIEIHNRYERLKERLLLPSAQLRVMAKLRRCYPHLPRRFTLPSVEVENYYSYRAKYYRYAQVFRESDILNLAK